MILGIELFGPAVVVAWSIAWREQFGPWFVAAGLVALAGMTLYSLRIAGYRMPWDQAAIEQRRRIRARNRARRAKARRERALARRTCIDMSRLDRLDGLPRREVES